MARYGADTRYLVDRGNYRGTEWTAWGFVQNGSSQPCVLVTGFYYSGGTCFGGGFDPQTGVDAAVFSGLLYNGPSSAAFVVGFAPEDVSRIRINDEIRPSAEVETVAAAGIKPRFFVALLGDDLPYDLAPGQAQPTTSYTLMDPAGRRIEVRPIRRPLCSDVTFGAPTMESRGDALLLRVLVHVHGARGCQASVDVFPRLTGQRGDLPVDGNGDDFALFAAEAGDYSMAWALRNWCVPPPNNPRFHVLNYDPGTASRNSSDLRITRLPPCVSAGNRSGFIAFP